MDNLQRKAEPCSLGHADMLQPARFTCKLEVLGEHPCTAPHEFGIFGVGVVCMRTWTLELPRKKGINHVMLGQ